VIPDIAMVYGPPEYASIVLTWNSPTTALYLPSYGDITDPAWQQQVWRGAAVRPPRQPKRGLHRELDAGLAQDLDDRDSGAQRLCGLELLQHPRSG
jgi:hypothetical protein